MSDIISKNQLYILLDLFMSQYGWEFKYAFDFIMEQNADVVIKLAETINVRKERELRQSAYLNGLATGLAFNGKNKELGDLLITEEEEDPETETEEQAKRRAKGHLKAMWVRLGRNPDDFEKEYASGKVVM